MAITATTVLAPAVTAGESTTIVVDAGATATIGIYTETPGGRLPLSVSFDVHQLTPGQPNRVARLKQEMRSVTLAGPGSFTVVRPDFSNAAATSAGSNVAAPVVPFGVFADKG